MPELAAGIEPGSLAYGDRDDTEQALAGLGGGAGPPGVTPGQAVPPLGADPVQALLGGNVVPPSALPVTDGLNVGPGSNPSDRFSGVPDAMDERLRLIATQARTPHLRYLARRALQRRVRLPDGAA
jgi:hypothetical protein